MKIVIDRKQWLRGEERESYLLRPYDGKMCVMGFIGLACGYSDDDLRGLTDPEDLCNIEKENRWPDWAINVEFNNPEDFEDWEKPPSPVVYHNSDLVNDLIEVNDSTSLDDKKREHMIANLLKDRGVDIEFVGD